MAVIDIKPGANPLTFFEVGVIDFRRYYPNMFNSPHMTYVPGIHRTQYCQKFVRGQRVKFQLKSDTAPTVVLIDNNTFEELAITAVAVNPPLWVGTNVWEYSHLVYKEGEYYFKATSDATTLISEPLYFMETNKNAVRISYSHDSNDYNMIFTKDEGETFTWFDFLIDGRADLNDNQRVAEDFNKDDGGLSTQDVVIQIIRIAELSPIPSFMVDRMSYICACKKIKLNGLLYQVAEFNKSRLEGTNMYEMSISFQLTDDDAGLIQKQKVVIQSGNTIINDDNLIIINNGTGS